MPIGVRVSVVLGILAVLGTTYVQWRHEGFSLPLIGRPAYDARYDEVARALGWPGAKAQYLIEFAEEFPGDGKQQEAISTRLEEVYAPWWEARLGRALSTQERENIGIYFRAMVGASVTAHEHGPPPADAWVYQKGAAPVPPTAMAEIARQTLRLARSRERAFPVSLSECGDAEHGSEERISSIASDTVTLAARRIVLEASAATATARPDPTTGNAPSAARAASTATARPEGLVDPPEAVSAILREGLAASNDPGAGDPQALARAAVKHAETLVREALRRYAKMPLCDRVRAATFAP